ncbi:MAG: hypothetical protein AAFV62_09800 [Pseudomonadota bacterium]
MTGLRALAALATCVIAIATTAQAHPQISVPPGFCAVSSLPDAAVLVSSPAEVVVRYADCRELAAKKAGRQRTIETFGQAVLRTSIDIGATPVTRASVPLEELRPRLPELVKSLRAGEAAVLGVIENTKDLSVAATIKRPETGSSATLHFVVTTEVPGMTVKRELVLPYRNDDTLRYMLASLRATAIADRIALSYF